MTLQSVLDWVKRTVADTGSAVVDLNSFTNCDDYIAGFKHLPISEQLCRWAESNKLDYELTKPTNRITFFRPPWQREHLGMPHQPDDRQTRLQQLALEYHLRSEGFDRLHCHYFEKGIARPGGPEIVLCTNHAASLRLEMFNEQVKPLGVRMQTWRDAIADAGHEFDQRVQSGWLDKFITINEPSGYKWHLRDRPAQVSVRVSVAGKFKATCRFIHREDGEVAEIFDPA